LFYTLFFPWLIFNICCLACDKLFFGYGRIDPKPPLFIVGVPRSGTTFLHRLCALDEQQFTTMPLWEIILAPSLLQKYFFWALYRIDLFFRSPGYRLIKWIEQKAFGSIDAIHSTSLFEPEEDYLTLIPVVGCFLMVQPFPQSELVWRLAYFDRDFRESDRARVIRFYKSIVQRHLYFRGEDRILLSKNPSFTPLTETLRQEFPGCHIVACRRDPMAVVPSLLNSMKSGADLFGNSIRDEHFRDRFIKMLQHFYGCVESSENWIAEYGQISSNPEQLVRDLYRDSGFEIGSEFDEKLRMATERSRDYRSRHSYSLSHFGLDASDIHAHFAEAIKSIES